MAKCNLRKVKSRHWCPVVLHAGAVVSPLVVQGLTCSSLQIESIVLSLFDLSILLLPTSGIRDYLLCVTGIRWWWTVVGLLHMFAILLCLDMLVQPDFLRHITQRSSCQ